jgi:predicted DNA binding CopG/RHH family protein
MKPPELKDMPSLTSDDAAEKFVETADLSHYDLSHFKPVRFEFETKAADLNVRLPATLVDAVKEKAKAEGIPYTRYVQLVLEKAVTP